jgi:hypothetical protein
VVADTEIAMFAATSGMFAKEAGVGESAQVKAKA